MKKKKQVLVALAAAFTLGTTFASLAGWEQSEQGWQYKGESTGTYFIDGAQWIDGNGDGIYERYHFDDEGYLITSSTELYEVNSDGMELKDGQPRTVDMAQLKAGLNKGFFRKEYLDLLACDKSAVDKVLGTPVRSTGFSADYNAPDGSQIYAEFDDGGRLLSLTGKAELLCVFAKDSYALDEIDTIMGSKRNSDFLPMWRYGAELAMNFAYAGTNTVINKKDTVSLRIYL